MALLEIRQLQKKFGSNQVLTDVSLRVEPQTIYGLIGENGAGKTTTMKMILGLLPIEDGEIFIDGKKVTYGANQTNKLIGYLPDVPEFYGYMTAKEYLQLCAKVSSLPKEITAERIRELLALVGLADTKKRISGYSRGMKQRLGIAQALLNKPKLLICDEPTSALDPKGRKEILDILLAIKAETTIIFSTHILSDVERICDEIGLLHQGTIHFQGNMQALKQQHQIEGFEIDFADPQTCQTFSESYGAGEKISATRLRYEKRPKNELRQVMELCARENIIPIRIEQLEPTLESVFLEVIQNETITSL